MTDPRDPARARGRRRSFGRPLGAVLALAGILAACSPAPTAAPTTAASAPGPVATPTAIPIASPTVAPSEPPGPTPVATPAAAACTAADVKVSHGLVEGTAGARNTEVVIVAGVPCAVAAWPAFGIRDGQGRALIAGASEGPGMVTLLPDRSYVSEARVSNWCGLDPTFPLTLELRLGDEAVPVTGGSFPEDADMPPCTAGTAPMLTGTPWTPSS